MTVYVALLDTDGDSYETTFCTFTRLVGVASTPELAKKMGEDAGPGTIQIIATEVDGNELLTLIFSSPPSSYPNN